MAVTDLGDGVYGVSPCYGCNRVFAFRPHLVPVVVDGESRHPLCRECVITINEVRRTTPGIDLPPIDFDPDAWADDMFVGVHGAADVMRRLAADDGG